MSAMSAQAATTAAARPLHGVAAQFGTVDDLMRAAEQVKDAGDLSRLVNRKEEGEVTLTVMRDKQRRTIRLTPERRQPQSFPLTPGVVAPARVAAAPTAARAVRAPRVMVTPPRINILPPRVLRMRPERIVSERAL